MGIEWIPVKTALPAIVGVYAVAYRENRGWVWCKALYSADGEWTSISEPLGCIEYWANVELPTQ